MIGANYGSRMHVMRSIRVAWLLFSGAAALLAQYHYPFQNPNLPMEERVNNIVSLMTLRREDRLPGHQPERAAPGHQGHRPRRKGCTDWRWAVRAAGAGPTPIPTTQFAQDIGMGETWDPDLIRLAGGVEGYETRYINQSEKTHRGGWWCGLPTPTWAATRAGAAPRSASARTRSSTARW